MTDQDRSPTAWLLDCLFAALWLLLLALNLWWAYRVAQQDWQTWTWLKTAKNLFAAYWLVFLPYISAYSWRRGRNGDGVLALFIGLALARYLLNS